MGYDDIISFISKIIELQYANSWPQSEASPPIRQVISVPTQFRLSVFFCAVGPGRGVVTTWQLLVLSKNL